MTDRLSKSKLLLLVFGTLCIVSFLLHKCDKNVTDNTSKPALLPGESAKIEIKPSAITVVTKDRPPVTVRVPHSGIVVLKEDGTLKYSVKQFGLSFNPGSGIGFSSLSHYHVFMDARLVYLYRFGGHAGFNIAIKDSPIVRPFVGVSYALPLKFTPNTSVMVGYQLSVKEEPWTFGLRVSF